MSGSLAASPMKIRLPRYARLASGIVKLSEWPIGPGAPGGAGQTAAGPSSATKQPSQQRGRARLSEEQRQDGWGGPTCVRLLAVQREVRREGHGVVRKGGLLGEDGPPTEHVPGHREEEEPPEPAVPSH